jgi:hypothetical protein
MEPRAEEYAEGDLEFANWLEAIDLLIQKQVQLSLFDLEDMDLRASFDSGDTPEMCLLEVVAEAVAEN